MIVRDGQKLVSGKKRRLAGSEVSENHPALLLAGIRRMSNRVSICASPGLSRLIDDIAAFIVKPAMIDAAQAPVLHPAVTQIGAAVRAVKADETRLALVVAKHDQILA
jgi:hypothetical protein